ncbi:hypothetical protein BpHYR1_045797 [Brachionus plicatilis]|uniref:Uncharacterized protein n=1 Tax=Brachionus plicatilis TaxID=10195 RepID=A0A3M7QWZ4_BRAPC|nr:hypothetical protein BpHYR1_045797 [Brachionus plicatilis]
MSSANNNLISYLPNTWFSCEKSNIENPNHDCMVFCLIAGRSSSATVNREEKMVRMIYRVWVTFVTPRKFLA